MIERRGAWGRRYPIGRRGGRCVDRPDQLGEHLPPHLQWLPACCDPAKLRIGDERGLVRLWTIALSNHPVIVFESQPKPGRRRPRS
jgi:hypothetical protein